VLALAGNVTEALAAYRRLGLTLEAHGRAPPDAELQALHEELVRSAPRAADRVATGAGPRTEVQGTEMRDAAPSAPGLQARPRLARAGSRAAALGVAAIVLLLTGAAVLGRWQPSDARDVLLVRELEVPKEPSIAVLPFTTLPEAAQQHHFADGLTDTLINDLSQLHKILVIARHSAFTYRGSAIDVREVGRELGVRHVLKGTVQIDEARVRIGVQLLEAATGRQVWGERYDRALQDIFALQDEIANRVVEELDVKLVTGEQARTWRRMTASLDAYSEVLAGRAVQMRDHSIDGLLRQRTYFRRAIELDPEFALPWAYMVSVHQHLIDGGYRGEPGISYEATLGYADRAVELAPQLPIARAYRGSILQQLMRHEEALREFRLAIEYGPNDAESLMLSAWGITAVGDAREALPHALRAMRLDPVRPGWYWGGLGDVYLGLQRWEEAFPVFERCLVEVRGLIWCHAGLTVAYARAGRIDEARRAAQDWRAIDPKASAENNFYVIAWGDATFRELLTRSLREAGM
jgi:TolB-like protein